MSALPEGPDWWQWQHQNYARLLLKAGMGLNGKFDRTEIDSVLSEVERIQGKKERQVLSDFLNHERKAMADDIELIKPQSVIDCELAYQATLHDSQSKVGAFEQQKRDIAASIEFNEKLAS